MGRWSPGPTPFLGAVDNWKFLGKRRLLFFDVWPLVGLSWSIRLPRTCACMVSTTVFSRLPQREKESWSWRGDVLRGIWRKLGGYGKSWRNNMTIFHHRWVWNCQWCRKRLKERGEEGKNREFMKWSASAHCPICFHFQTARPGSGV